jgi:hypothetical protein
MTKRFPKFASHQTATCFNCEGDFDGSHWSDSGYPAGGGAFRQECCKCGMSTFYDLSPTSRKLTKPERHPQA